LTFKTNTSDKGHIQGATGKLTPKIFKNLCSCRVQQQVAIILPLYRKYQLTAALGTTKQWRTTKGFVWLH